MQYLLTQEELDALKAKAERSSNMPTHVELQNFCTFVANTMPVQQGWMKGKPWGCVLTKEGVSRYCDDCPARLVCPKPYKPLSQ